MQLVKKFILSFIILSFPFIFSINTFAMSPSESVRVTPAYISLTEKTGSSAYENLSIFNNSNTVLNLDVYKRGIKYEHKKLILINSKLQSNVENWMSIKDTRVTIQPFKTQNISVYINVPKNEKYGSYNGGIVVSNIPQHKIGNSTIFGRIVVNVFINIRGKNKGYSNINITNLNYQSLIFKNSATLNLEAYNPGPYNNAYKTKIYDSSIFGLFNSVTGKSGLENILLGQTRYNSIDLKNLKIGINNIQIHLSNIGDNTTKNINFTIFYIPFETIYILILILVLIFIYHSYRLRKIQRKLKNHKW
jgi:hypothetical protein